MNDSLEERLRDQITIRREKDRGSKVEREEGGSR